MYFSISEQTSCSQRKIRSAEHSLKLERWQGPPHVHRVKQYTLCCPLRSVCVFSLFSHESKETLFIKFV